MLWLLLFLVFISIFIKQTINNLGTGLLRIVVKQLGCAENPIIEENCYLRGSSELSLSLSFSAKKLVFEDKERHDKFDRKHLLDRQ